MYNFENYNRQLITSLFKTLNSTGIKFYIYLIIRYLFRIIAVISTKGFL